MDVKQVIADLQKRHPGEPQFLQAATEVLESVAEIYNQNPKFEKNRIIERIIEPDRVFMFKVPWEDDKGEIHVYSSTVPLALTRGVSAFSRM